MKKHKGMKKHTGPTHHADMHDHLPGVHDQHVHESHTAGHKEYGGAGGPIIGHAGYGGGKGMSGGEAMGDNEECCE